MFQAAAEGAFFHEAEHAVFQMAVEVALRAQKRPIQRSSDAAWNIGMFQRRRAADGKRWNLGGRRQVPSRDWLARRYLTEADDRQLSCPGVTELARRAKDYAALSEAARVKSDPVNYLAGLIASRPGPRG